MQAQVRKDCRFRSIVAFNGQEYTKLDWRPVPKGFEEEARRHSFLTIREESAPRILRKAATLSEAIRVSEKPQSTEPGAAEDELPETLPWETESTPRKRRSTRKKKSEE